MSIETDIREFVRKSCALNGGVTLDYIAIRRRDTPKSWPEHATVRVEDRSVDDVTEELLGHISNISDSAMAEQKGSWAIRLMLFRAKMPAGSRTFNSDTVPGGSPKDDDDDDDDNPKSALVTAFKISNKTATDLAYALANQATGGYKLASDTLAQNGVLLQLLHETNAKLIVAEQATASDPTDAAMAGLLGNLPATLAQLMALAEARKAMADAERAAAEAKRAAGDGPK